MLPLHVANRITDALLGMAQANWHDFSSDPKLCRLYKRNLDERRHRYVPDRQTCGLADCWSTYRALATRYPYPSSILLDCEDAACAHSAWLASQCYQGGDRILVGLVPGKRISHAVSGVERTEKGVKRIIVVDPSRWYGMAPTHYDNPLWRYVTP